MTTETPSAPVAAPAAAPLPAHLVELSGSDGWALWRWMGLRGAGFPASQILDLAVPDCAAQADALLEAEASCIQARQAASTAINDALDALRARQSWDDSATRDPLLRAARALRQGQLPRPEQLDPAIQAWIAQISAAQTARDQAQAAWEQCFQSATAQISQRIGQAVQRDDLCEAIIWQNRRAFHTGVLPLRRAAAEQPRTSKRRQHEELVAQYLQRYCVKNDTIGFFGPVGWARLCPEGPLQIRPGPSLLAKRQVYFEQWCIDALAETLARNRALLPWCAPRRLPYSWLEGETLVTPNGGRSPLTPAQLLVLRASDGSQPANTLAERLAQTHPQVFGDASQVMATLDLLKRIGLITWTLELPFQTNPEQALRQRLELIGDERLRSTALRALAALEQARNAVGTASDPQQLDSALGTLEHIFTRLTGGAATRADGAMYAGRTLVYEDCRRALQAEIGQPFLDALGAPLGLLLDSARWFTAAAAARYRQVFRSVYDQLAAQGSPTVAAIHFWQALQAHLREHGGTLIDALVEDFQARWASILMIAPEQRRVSYASADLRAAVRTAFAASGPGWPIARYHCPDVLVAAEDAAAFARGEFLLVMGELHIAANTLRGAFFVAEHPAPHELYQAVESDLGQIQLAPLVPKSWPGNTSRTRPTLAIAASRQLIFSDDLSERPAEQQLPIGDLQLADVQGELRLYSRDGQVQLDPIECFAELLSRDVLDRFKLFPAQPHTPRVTVDRLVINRESWRFAPAALDFATAKRDAERFLLARRWASTHGIPRWIFVTSPVERKPIYIDLASPLLVEQLARLVRRTSEHGPADARIGVSEMLPGFDQAWLPDAAGQRYTSEFRIVAVDHAS